jgi:hypothetical protein
MRDSEQALADEALSPAFRHFIDAWADKIERVGQGANLPGLRAMDPCQERVTARHRRSTR